MHAGVFIYVSVSMCLTAFMFLLIWSRLCVRVLVCLYVSLSTCVRMLMSVCIAGDTKWPKKVRRWNEWNNFKFLYNSILYKIWSPKRIGTKGIYYPFNVYIYYGCSFTLSLLPFPSLFLYLSFSRPLRRLLCVCD